MMYYILYKIYDLLILIITNIHVNLTLRISPLKRGANKSINGHKANFVLLVENLFVYYFLWLGFGFLALIAYRRAKK